MFITGESPVCWLSKTKEKHFQIYNLLFFLTSVEIWSIWEHNRKQSSHSWKQTLDHPGDFTRDVITRSTKKCNEVSAWAGWRWRSSQGNWSPISCHECKCLGVIERYQFICCSLMTHEIKKYLMHRYQASLSVCLEHGYYGNNQSILVTNCGGGWLEVCASSVYIYMQLSAFICD